MATANKFNLFISPPPDNLKCVICQELTVLIAVLLAKDNFILLSFKECINHQYSEYEMIKKCQMSN